MTNPSPVPPAAERGLMVAAERAVIVLAVLMAIFALSWGRLVFVPLSIALVLATVLRPVVARLERMRLPAPAAAAIVVLGSLAVLGDIGTALAQPVRELTDDLPKSISVARQKVDAMTARLRALAGSPAKTPRDSTAVPAAVAQPAKVNAGGKGSGGGDVQGTVRTGLSITSSLLTEIVEELLLVFFLLAAGRGWMDKLARVAGGGEKRRRWQEIAEEMHNVVARYLVVTLLINLVQAVVVGLVLWALGVPTPLLWGALTFVAEFIPYLGGIVMIALLAAAGLAGTQGTAHALLAPAAYLLITTLQNNLVSPIAYGRGLRLNPTMILLGVMFWWMMWGVAGAFLAVPILASLRVLGSRIPALEPMAVLLEE